MTRVPTVLWVLDTQTSPEVLPICMFFTCTKTPYNTSKISRLNIHPVSGVITVKTPGGPSWDREQVSRHFLTVEARDDLGNGNRNSVQLTINLEDVNDNSPVFVQAKYEARLSENQPEFQTLLRVEARDADLNGQFNYYCNFILKLMRLKPKKNILHFL